MPSRRVFAPWSDTLVDAVIAWQIDPLKHPLTCEQHSDIPLAVSNERLRCLVDGCSYTQKWVPQACVAGACDES